MKSNYIENIDWIEGLKSLPDKCIHTSVSSPPYYALRDYGIEGQLGLEPTPELYIQKLADGYDILKDKLRDDGTIWVNIGDSYAHGPANRTDNQVNNHSTITGGFSTQLEQKAVDEKLPMGSQSY